MTDAPAVHRGRRRLYQAPEAEAVTPAPLAEAVLSTPDEPREPAKLAEEDLLWLEEQEKIVLLDQTRRRLRADQIILDNLFWVTGASFIPIPLVDVATVTTIQLKMINELSLIYSVQFARNRGKAILTALAGGTGATALTWLKLIPGHGTVVGSMNFALMGGIITYAVGKLFIDHFEAGGDLADFDAEQNRARFQLLLAEGKRKVGAARRA